jgi:hypothetical protein
VDHDDPEHVEMLFRKSWRSTQAATTATTTATATAAAIGADFKARQTQSMSALCQSRHLHCKNLI